MLSLDKALLENVLHIAEKAGEAILEIYHQTEDVEVEKKDDDSPVTAADHAAHKLIVEALKAAYPDVPIFSEESGGIDFKDREHWDEFWLVDPLDGTKEFINRTGEFTVNIALIQEREPVLGVVTVPLKNSGYIGAKGVGAYKVLDHEPWQAINVRDVNWDQLIVVGSRRHGAEALDALIAKFSQHFTSIETANMGSSLKFCLIAEGKADIYPRLAPTSEWDTAAAQAVLMEAGGIVLDKDFSRLQYNKGDSVLNPHFFAFGDTSVDWQSMIIGEHQD